jgi:hypothetical protein
MSMIRLRSIAAFTWVAVSLLSGCFPAELRDRHASVVEAYLRTPFLEGDEPFADPASALGPPDGRTVALGVGAYVILRFFREIPNGPGPDLRVYEVGPDNAEAAIAVSSDGVDFIEATETASGPTTELELDDALPAGKIRFIRIRGVDDRGNEPGFDLDAVEALN